MTDFTLEAGNYTNHDMADPGAGYEPAGDEADNIIEKEFGRGAGDPLTNHTKETASGTAHTADTDTEPTHSRCDPGFGNIPFGDPSSNIIEKEFGRGFGDPTTVHLNDT